MAPSVAAGCPLGRASLTATLMDLQACITEPARIIYYYTRHIVRRLIFDRETGGERESVRVKEKETVKGTGTAEKESTAVDDDEDYNQQVDDDDSVIDYAAEYDEDEEEEDDEDEEEEEDDDDSVIDYAAEYKDDDHDRYIDYAYYLRDDPIERLRNQRIGYTGASTKLGIAYYSSRYLVELLAVRPRFHFVGNLYAGDSNGRSLYYCSSERGENCNIDSKGNLILHTEGSALQDDFYIEIRIPEDDDAGFFSFTVDPHACNHVIKRTISTARNRKIDLTFIPMHNAMKANVEVTLDLISGSTTRAYVYGEITAHHLFYGTERVVLFSCREEDKAEVINGQLPLSRNWAAVPVNLEPLLIIKMNVCVLINHDGEGHTISLQGDATFFHDQDEKIICSADHGEVKVQLSYH